VWAAWIVVVSLAAVWPTVCSGEGGKSTPTAPALFLWSIHRSLDPQRLTFVGVMPTSFALATGLDVKTITIMPTANADDPRPQPIQPVKTMPAPRWGLQVWFKPPPGRRYEVIVTLADGSTHTLDLFTPCPDTGPRSYELPKPPRKCEPSCAVRWCARAMEPLTIP
jgi:hypothetical protein